MTSCGVQVSMALGLLFLGGGAASLGTSNAAVAALLLALYPRLPTTPQDNRCHLQARSRTLLRAETLHRPPSLTRYNRYKTRNFVSSTLQVAWPC
jgi:hypothetical protein